MNEDGHLAGSVHQGGGVPEETLNQVEPVDRDQTAAIYFCFIDDKYDKVVDPNKLILARGAPTVADLCSTLKVLFFPGHEVTLTASFVKNPLASSAGTSAISCMTEYPETSADLVPVNDRANVVLLKTRYIETAPRLNPQTIQILHWLQANCLDTPELVNVFLQNRIVLDNIKFLKDSDLINFGLKEWGTRISILEAINKYFTFLPSFLDAQSAMSIPTATRSIFTGPVIPAAGSTTANNSVLMGHMDPHYQTSQQSALLSNKRPKTASAKKRMRFKDLDVLVNDPLIPVDVGSSVYCIGSPIKGSVVLNKHKKPVIEYLLKGKKQTGTVAQFYKAVTGEPLQAKGDSWSKIFFTDKHNNNRSLEDIKYIIKGPKKAVSAFLYYSKEIRETLGKTSDFAKKSGDMWKALSEENKKKYRQKEQEDKERFNREKNQWNILISQLQQQRGVTELSDMYGEGDSQDDD